MASKKIENQNLQELENTRKTLKGTMKGIIIVWILITILYVGYIANRMINYDDLFSRFNMMLTIWILGTITLLFVTKSQQKKINDEIVKRKNQ